MKTRDIKHRGAAMDRKTQVAETLRERIISMDLAPGDVVDEVALSKEFGLSRPPLRELMRQMATEGYLVLEANRPARVSPMDYQSLRSFFLAAPLIYVATTQLAARNATADDVARLREIQAAFCAAIAAGDVAARVLHNNRFHLEIGNIARNPYLMPSLRRLLIDHARLGKTFYRASDSGQTREEAHTAMRQHDQIIDAVARHDVQETAELVHAHWELSRRHMTDYVVPESMDVPLQF